MCPGCPSMPPRTPTRRPNVRFARCWRRTLTHIPAADRRRESAWHASRSPRGQRFRSSAPRLSWAHIGARRRRGLRAPMAGSAGALQETRQHERLGRRHRAEGSSREANRQFKQFVDQGGYETRAHIEPPHRTGPLTRPMRCGRGASGGDVLGNSLTDVTRSEAWPATSQAGTPRTETTSLPSNPRPSGPVRAGTPWCCA